MNGQYMVALLYREWFCLATASRVDQVYAIQACIALSNVKVEEVDNGRGENANGNPSRCFRSERLLTVHCRTSMSHSAVFLEDCVFVRSPAL